MVGPDRTGGTDSLSTRFFTDVLKVRHLRILVALDQLGQVSKVARVFNVTQPAISKQLAELQKELGSQIIRREGSNVVFTPIGEMLVRHAQEVLSRLQRAEFDLEAFRRGLGGKVRVGAAASLISSIVPEAIRQLLRAAPSAQVSVSEGHFNRMLPALKSGEIDIMVTRVWKPMSLDGIDQIPLGSEPIVVVAGRDHPLAKTGEVDWPEALRWPWLRASSGSLASEAINGFLADRGHPPLAGFVEATSILLTLQLLRESPFLAALPAKLARHHSTRGELSILPLDFGGVLSEVKCFWLSDENDETIGLFRTCLSRAAVELLD